MKKLGGGSWHGGGLVRSLSLGVVFAACGLSAAEPVPPEGTAGTPTPPASTPAAAPSTPPAASGAAPPAPAPSASASPPATPPATAADLELLACGYGRSRFPENFAFKDGRAGQSVPLAWSFYVARTGTEVTLIDTGFSGADVAKKWGVSLTREPALLLADLNIAPEAVTRILITHIHFDHLSNLALFPLAQVCISRRDRDDYVSQRPLGGVTYLPEVAAILNDPARTHVIDEREVLPGGFDFEVIGGHTHGSAIVHLWHAGVHHVLAGDECYLCANLTAQRPIGRTFNPARNLALLHRLAEPGLVLLPCHDPEIYTRYPEVVPGVVRVFGR